MRRAWFAVGLIGLGGVLIGTGTFYWGLRSISEGKTTIGWVVATLAVIGGACGAAALVAAIRHR